MLLGFSILIDLFFGEFPNFIHPVVYMGVIGKRFEKIKGFRFFFGMLSLLLEISFWLFLCKMLVKVNYFFELYFLSSTFSIRALYVHVKRCKTNNLKILRRNVSFIVSRDVSFLDKNHLYSAALESLSENISDSIVAPLFYYLIFGIYGALLYRVVNTYDALFGYRTERYEWFGKFPARFDDFLNFIPARLTAFLIILFNFRAIEYLKRYRKLKINSMYPMAAFAGVLGLGFEKIGVYKLEGKGVELGDIDRGLRLYKKVVFLWIVILMVMVVLKERIF
ncbi:cobalamin biosynthesis protein CobD [Thermosipho melanesiensis]|uniref:Cobalamin biosynthesis protein CobD n=2 Tax=Thermosipho melanesiensis TaxID=46541 RepID=A6LLB9_THEM4|nr:adenosylcobinamide-phosphate synthase CbiB [Thermosipho melanesiensis]ABR30720.1 cobalamin biosynthesis protein CobD [Thermosipho melanesiensis BI429]APT73849.1 cobalamin biosynthesis protein CobD [Thermosipho melanesiensis]OOC35789.1 cobalamin biosynthesis protein CobD [Thermosipho melanesiensis]OOC38291.1 cobalamin biosynthesis protein CobD [Thermosipho melanesiensis]OOC38752.1 cobalamin biosynthesis protein CobD [Thermosipho melanesiensis]